MLTRTICPAKKAVMDDLPPLTSTIMVRLSLPQSGGHVFNPWPFVGQIMKGTERIFFRPGQDLGWGRGQERISEM